MIRSNVSYHRSAVTDILNNLLDFRILNFLWIKVDNYLLKWKKWKIWFRWGTDSVSIRRCYFDVLTFQATLRRYTQCTHVQRSQIRMHRLTVVWVFIFDVSIFFCSPKQWNCWCSTVYCDESNGLRSNYLQFNWSKTNNSIHSDCAKRIANQCVPYWFLYVIWKLKSIGRWKWTTTVSDDRFGW